MAWGAASMGRNSEMMLGNSWPAYLGAADAQAVQGHVVGGDPALGDDPGGLGGQRVPDGLGQGSRDRAGDGQAAGGIAAADHGTAGIEQDIGSAQRRGDLPCRVSGHLVRADDDRGDVEFDVGGDTARAQCGNLPAGLADVGSDHDQAVAAAACAGPDLLAAKRRHGRQARQGPPSSRTRRVQWHPCRSWPALEGGSPVSGRSATIGSEEEVAEQRRPQVRLPADGGDRDTITKQREPARTRARCGTGTTGRPARPAAHRRPPSPGRSTRWR